MFKFISDRFLTSTLPMIALALLASSPLAEESVKPGINDHYQTPAFDRWRATFERRGREVYDKREAVVAAMGLEPGMAVADVGAGSGFYSLLFADAVGENGKVYVVDIADYFVEGTLARGEELGLKNLVGVVNNARSVMLPDHSVDRIFVSATYHHFEYPQSTLASMVAALKPGGELIIVDYRKRPLVASMWVQSHVRLDRQEVIDEVEQAGFRYLDEPLELKQFYMLRFARD